MEYLKLTEIATRHGITHGSMFDFGGSTGRVFRHFHYQGEWDIWSSDFKRSSVEWNFENYPAKIKVFQGLYQPILPIESRTFDLVIAMSVFTHIDETETSWLLELRRIMKPGGIALLTIHNEATWKVLDPGLRDTIEKYSPDLAALSELPPGRHVSNFRNYSPPPVVGGTSDGEG
ncbi:class I SAM-dependent methyltransferase, partial [uncultured Sphingomonas sp.]|uniref:class I SAM-dependent methyltransferase n=1 Tax=uncultured Sphingomonas sp. TaxID=158754 RepID=UPI0035C9516A